MSKLLDLYIAKREAIRAKFETEKDELIIVDYSIELFYLNDTIENMENQEQKKPAKTFISKEDSDKRIDIKAKKYNRIIALLQLKVQLLEKKKALSKDELEKVNLALDIHDIENEIEGKKSFLSAWIKRKEIMP